MTSSNCFSSYACIITKRFSYISGILESMHPIIACILSCDVLSVNALAEIIIEISPSSSGGVMCRKDGLKKDDRTLSNVARVSFSCNDGFISLVVVTFAFRSIY